MVRVTTSNYGADPTTQFAWATTDQDLFDREDDLYNLAQAVEFHDHSSGRGLPVARLAAGSAAEAAIAALAVTTTKLGNLAVTNGKLADGAVTREKITFPLVQPSNDMAGGYRQRETSNTYALGLYMAANGLAVFGAGTISAIGTNLIMGQSGQVSVGTVQGAGKFNVIQTADGNGSGIRVYHPNQVHYIGFRNDVNGRIVLDINANSFFYMHQTTGYVTLGTAASDAARLHLTQITTDAAEGIRLTQGGGVGQVYSGPNGNLVLASATTSTWHRHDVQGFTPLANDTTHLGYSDRRWTKVWAKDLDLSGSISVSGGGSVPGAVPLNGIVIFRTAAERTAAGASWAAYSDADGRLLVGAGTTFSQTFTEATNYGSNWTPLAGVTTGPGSQEFNAGAGGQPLSPSGHDHTIAATTWLPPMRAVVFGRRNS